MNKAISYYHEAFGFAVRQYREEKALSIPAFAELCGIRADVLKRIEKGEVNFRLTTLLKLKKVMGEVPLPRK